MGFLDKKMCNLSVTQKYRIKEKREALYQKASRKM